MGIPENFSLDIPQRCQMLIECLWEEVSNKRVGRELPLNASFLLAISTPMVNLPIERIWKPQMNRAVGHLNDAVLDRHLAATIRKGFGSEVVAKAGFFRPGTWRYHYLARGSGVPDLSQDGLPKPVEEALESPGAEKAAGKLSTASFCTILRNGLAHGGILYLDKDGQTTRSAPVQMFCFVSTKQSRRNWIEGLHFLRVGMDDYRAFLQLWTDWLQASATPSKVPAQLAAVQ